MTTPSPEEANVARYWLARHGVRVEYPTEFLAVRIGASEIARTRARLGRNTVIAAGVAGVLAVACVLGGLGGLPTLVIVASSIGVRTSWPVLMANRSAANRLSLPAARPGGFTGLGTSFAALYCAAAVITFGGGGALATIMALSGNPRAWKVVSALLLAAVVSGLAIANVLRAPVIAEDAASRAVDSTLRARDLHDASPALWSLYVPLAFMIDEHLPREFLLPAIGYSVLAVGVQAIGWLVSRRRFRVLPPGNYEWAGNVPAASDSTRS